MENKKIAVLGMGYVGLPLAVEFSKHFQVVGYDVNANKVDLIQSSVDPTHEIGNEELKSAFKRGLRVGTSTEDIRDCNVYIVTVPTDINQDKTPNWESIPEMS